MKTKMLKNLWFWFFIPIMIFYILLVPTSCSKDQEIVPNFKTDSVTDIDGNVYKTVKIGSQWWMAGDLKVKRYRNGDVIDSMGNFWGSGRMDSALWNHTITGAYYIGPYGFLYNGYIIDDTRNIAPIGWHIPDDEEWKTLEMSLGMSKVDADKFNWRGTNQGNKLKIQHPGVGFADWHAIEIDDPKAIIGVNDKYTVWGSNESGFSVISNGCVMFNGVEGNPGAQYTGFWWTATSEGNDLWYRYLDYQKANVFRYYGTRFYGFGVRCVKDENNVIN